METFFSVPWRFHLSRVDCIAKLIEQSRGYGMGEPGMRNVNRRHNFFVDDLKVYQESHNLLKESQG